MKVFKTAMIGDSHAKVVFRYLSKMLPKIGFPIVYQKAENGWSLKKHIQQGTLNSLQRSRPDLILVSLGGNNHSLNAEKYKRSVDKLINLAKSMGSSIVWVGPTASNPDTAASTERRHKWTTNFLKKYLPTQKVIFFNTREWTSGGWRNDGVHYPSSLYKKWAKIVSNRLNSVRNNLQPKTPLQKIKKWAWIGGGISGLILLGAVSYKLARRGSSAQKEDNVIPLWPKKEMDIKSRRALAEIAFSNQFNMSFPSWEVLAKQAAEVQRHNRNLPRHPATGKVPRNQKGGFGPFKPLPLQIVEIPINTVAQWAANNGLQLTESVNGFLLDVNPYAMEKK